jgi:hypothetical protein
MAIQALLTRCRFHPGVEFIWIFLGVDTVLLSHLELVLCLLSHCSHLVIDFGVSLLKHCNLLRQLLVFNAQLPYFLTFVRVWDVSRMAFSTFWILKCSKLKLIVMVLFLKTIDFLQQNNVFLHNLFVWLLKRAFRLFKFDGHVVKWLFKELALGCWVLVDVWIATCLSFDLVVLWKHVLLVQVDDWLLKCSVLINVLQHVVNVVLELSLHSVLQFNSLP